MEQLNFKGVRQIEKYVAEKQKIESKDFSKSLSKEMIREAIESIIEAELSKLPKEKESFEATGDNVTSAISATAYQSTGLTDKGKKQAEEILEELIDIALTKGISQAVKTSLKTKNAYLIDKLHDVLIDKFYEILKQ